MVPQEPAILGTSQEILLLLTCGPSWGCKPGNFLLYLHESTSNIPMAPGIGLHLAVDSFLMGHVI